MSDPIADLLTRVRNALAAGHSHVELPSSRLSAEICRVLKQEGYIEDYATSEGEKQGHLKIKLRYLRSGDPVIHEIKRVSKPSLRLYVKQKDLKQVRTGLGTAILTTSQGVMTEKEARRLNVGGELLCEVW